MTDENHETVEDSEAPPAEPPPAPKRKGLKRAIWLILLLAIIALGIVGYPYLARWQSAGDPATVDEPAPLADLDRRMTDADAAIATLETKLGQIEHPDYSADIDALRGDIDEQLRLLDSLPARMSVLENSVASLAGISTGARETFLLAEAEYYMQIANAQLQLANNPQLAALALGMADERVTQLSDPALIDVRRALSNELAELEVMEKPDIEGATLTLASLARVVESLPLAANVADRDDADAGDDEERSNIDRAWGSVKDAVTGLVRVTPPDEAKLVRLSPDAEYFLRNNIALQLQSARLALLRGEQSIFEQTLDDTATLLETFFDNDSAQVQSARQTLHEIRSSVFTVSAPDISGSLRLLRQFRTLNAGNGE